MQSKFPYIVTFIFLFIQCSEDDPVIVHDPQGEEEPTSIYEECLASVSENSLDIVTWNVKEFPLKEEYTINKIAEIISTQDPDLIAFQEITSTSQFDALLDKLDGWEGTLNYTGGLNLAYIYKISEIVNIGDAIPILTDNNYAFPRPPYLTSIEHTSGLETTLINVHLKCCSGSENENRREAASELLKSYIDETLPESAVIVLGDFNDLIIEEVPVDNVFANFIEDESNFRFTDMEIASGTISGWSYPSWPSHIDHILITNELFDNIVGIETLVYDECDDSYFDNISDHRPLMLRLSN